MTPDDSAQHDPPYEGGAFHPDFAGGRASGRLRVSSTGVHFESDKGDFDLALDGLKLELGGANDRLIFFSHPSHPGVTVHTADHAVLKASALLDHPGLAAQGRRARTKKRVALAILLTVLAVLAGSLIGLVLAKDWFVKLAANSLPVDWEIKAGDTLFKQVVLTSRIMTDADLTNQLRAITGPLLEGIQDNRYPLKFHIVEDPTLNAFAMPGGNVVLHSGLLLAADTPEEVAGVLGHEIGHITRRHSIRNIISSAGLYLIVSSLVGDASGLIAVVANNSAFLLDRKFSRDFEREADDVGWNYLLAANIEPKGMVTFFEKMRKEEQEMMDALPVGGAEGALSVISTHPATGERVQTMQARWDKLPKKSGYRSFDLNYAQFKDSLRAKLHSADNETVIE